MQSNPNESSQSSLQQLLGWSATGAALFLAGHTLYKELTKFRLEGKVVLITGGSRGLGLVLARQMAAKGARLAICARNEDQLKLAKDQLEQLGAKVLALRIDVTDRTQVQAMINDVIAEFGQIDLLINNAGIVQVGPVEAMRIEDFDDAMRVNFYAMLYAIHAIIPHFLARGEGRIANVTSIGGRIAVPHLLPYTASKFAATGLSEGMHAELKKHNIHVTTIVPNLMQTGSPRNILVKGDHEKEYAWFKLADSFPVISQPAERAAAEMIKAIEYGESHATLTLTAKLATFVQSLAPSWVANILALTNRLLPENVENGDRTVKGFEAESSLSQGKITSITDRAAVANNEL